MMTKEEIKNLSIAEIEFLMRDLQKEKDKRNEELYKSLVKDVLTSIETLESHSFGSTVAFYDENECYYLWQDLYKNIAEELRYQD